VVLGNPPGVLTRVATTSYFAGDLGLEGSLLSGILGGYVTGLLSGVLISLPAMFNGEYVTMPLLAAVGVMGGLLRDCASDTEDIWSFSPFFNFSQDRRRTLFHAFFFAAILLAEFLRQGLGAFGSKSSTSAGSDRIPLAGDHGHHDVFAVVLPLKICNTRNESKLQEQQRLLMRPADALTSQINPHFLQYIEFGIRADPYKSASGVWSSTSYRTFCADSRKMTTPAVYGEGLNFIDDTSPLGVRFGDKLNSGGCGAGDADMRLPSMLLQPSSRTASHGLSTKVKRRLDHPARQPGRRQTTSPDWDDGVGIPTPRWLPFSTGHQCPTSTRLKVLSALTIAWKSIASPARVRGSKSSSRNPNRLALYPDQLLT
jgi:two-component system LytT family sensor kinase